MDDVAFLGRADLEHGLALAHSGVDPAVVDHHLEHLHRVVDGELDVLGSERRVRARAQVLEDLLVDIGEGAAARPLLLDTRGASRLAQHPALGNKYDVTIREFLLQLTGKPVYAAHLLSAQPVPCHLRAIPHENAPLLDLVESLELRHGDEDDNGLLAAANVNFTGSRDLKGPKFGLELRDVVFEVNQRLRDAGLGLIGCGRRGVRRAQNLVLY